MQIQFILGILALFSWGHDFHFSHTTVHYNSQAESLEITVRVAVEDLENALETQGAPRLRIGTASENEKAEKLIKAYVRQSLKVFPNNQPTDYRWVGKELSKDLHFLYIYLESTNCNKQGKLTSLLVENSIFTEILADQTNIVLIEFEGKNKNLRFTKKQNKQVIAVNQP